MKKNFLTLLFLASFSFNLHSQSQEEVLKKVDKIIYSYHSIKSLEELVKRIDYDFKTDIEKARAAYTWIALNINYENDFSGLINKPDKILAFNKHDLKRRIKVEKEKLISTAFISKKGVCKEYAYLFQKICNLLNIKNQLIYGYIRNSNFDIGFMPKDKNHVWNSFKVNDKWIVIDVTLAAGYMHKNIWQKQFNTNFFNLREDDLKFTHYSNKSNTKKNDQLPLKDFCNLPLVRSGFKSNFKLLNSMGQINLKKGNKIKLQFKLPKMTKIYYQFDNHQYIIEATKTTNKEIVNISLPNPEKNTSLKIFFNQELALEYNVVVSE